jgi:hypothetical protein
MRLFFLCFEPLGRYNGYRWPYNPFNAQPSVGNVRLSAVESNLDKQACENKVILLAAT